MTPTMGMMWWIEGDFLKSVRSGIEYYKQKYIFMKPPSWVMVHTLEDSNKLKELEKDGIIIYVDKNTVLSNIVWIGGSNEDSLGTSKKAEESGSETSRSDEGNSGENRSIDPSQTT